MGTVLVAGKFITTRFRSSNFLCIGTENSINARPSQINSHSEPNSSNFCVKIPNGPEQTALQNKKPSLSFGTAEERKGKYWTLGGNWEKSVVTCISWHFAGDSLVI